MKKLNLIIVCFLLLSVSVFAAVNLTKEQETTVRNVVRQYCKLMSEFASNEDNVTNKPKIIELFSGNETTVFDDLITNKETSLNDYLINITGEFNHTLKFTFKGVEQATIGSITAPKIGSSKDDKFAEIEITKEINIPKKGNKTVKNFIIINLEKNYQIWGIGSNSEDPVNRFRKGCKSYANKQYEEALNHFEASAIKGYGEAQYRCGCMYIDGKGCKQLKKKEREEKGLEWLKDAVVHNKHEEAARALLNLTNLYKYM